MVITVRINTLFYSFKQGIKNIWRNKMFSLASIATMAACIFMFGLFYILVSNFTSMVKDAEEGVAVTVFERKEQLGGVVRNVIPYFLMKEFPMSRSSRSGIRSRAVRKLQNVIICQRMKHGRISRKYILKDMRILLKDLHRTIHLPILQVIRSI